MSNQLRTQTWIPDLIYVNGRFVSDTALVTDNQGRILELAPATSYPTGIRLQNRAILPGLVNAHSHAFQRVIRGRTEYRSSETTDSFWTWRELMYRAANTLDVDDIYVASRMAFLEMALSGITSVGEFHYLHHAPNGQPYDDPNLIAKEVIRAAQDVGLRIALLRVAYERAGFNQEPNPLQKRFIESAETYCDNLERLRSDLGDNALAWAGSAPHSVRAVSLNYLKIVNDYVSRNKLAIHMHVAEQPAEVAACIEEYGRSPVALLDTEGLLSNKFTAVHAIHVTPKAIAALAKRGAFVCACPTTERNLGDGVVPADGYLENGVPICLGTDSHTQIDLLEDARELEYHLRLQRKERNVLVPSDQQSRSALAARLFDCATINGGKSIGFNGGLLEPGATADFFTVDLNDPSIAGASEEDLLSNIVFSLSRTAIKDVVVQGRRIVENGHHPKESEIVEEFRLLQKRLWH
ncbi:MAG TPA: formimidoylglutamate deiminase [Pyrinomonadaceae bacterium]|nr:formimidoylglutamate deiminase [Pyrinomonadaceae bacterium]